MIAKSRSPAAGEEIKLIEVGFSYGSSEVLRGLSLYIGRGDIVGVVGQNGAGKSTLLRITGGALAPSSGSASLCGAEISKMKASDRAKKIALMPQESRIPFSYSAVEVVLAGRAPHLPAFGFESRRDEEIALEAMEKTDCAQFADRPVDSLSGGERQRVMLARAIAQKTGVLLLDEPTAFLDIRHQAAIHALISKLSEEEELTIVAAMHDLNLAAAFCRRIVMLKDGSVFAEGAPEEVLTEDTIRAVFDVDVTVGKDPATDKFYIVPTA